MLKHIVNNISLVGFQSRNFLTPIATPSFQQRFIKKHWNPKWKKLRRQKVIKVDLPNFHEKDNLTEEEIRSRMKSQGLIPRRPWSEVSFFMTCTGGIFEPYVPPEGDGKFSAVSKVGAKQKVEFIEKKGKSMWSVRKIKSFDESFNTSDFPEIAHDVYIKAHKLLAMKDKNIIDYITEKAYPVMVHNVENKQIVWKFLQSLEPCRIVHVRCTKALDDNDIYAQVTCRFHTQQILAVYDRFGRLMHGSENVPKDVLEYIVFERHLANEYGNWRIHDKIIPPWMPSRQASEKTYVLVKDKVEQKDAEEKVVISSEQQSIDTKAQPVP